jgi:hypothetical protein
MPAEQQCAELAAIRQELSWVREGKKTALFEPYLYINDHFAKTGSG